MIFPSQQIYEVCWNHDMSRAWQIARQLTEKQMGPRRRQYDKPQTQRRTIQEWDHVTSEAIAHGISMIN